MTKVKFEKQFYDICVKHNIVVFFNDPSISDKNNGYAQWNEVHLGNRYSNLSTYIAVAFHEFAHAIINMKTASHVKTYNVNSIWNEEYSAWFWAMKYYQKYFGKSFNKTQGLFVLKCLKTHATSEYDFKNTNKS